MMPRPKSFTAEEWIDLCSMTFHRPLPIKIMQRVFATVDVQTLELAKLRTKNEQLYEVVRCLLLSADASWEEKGEGHDWREACARARASLPVIGGAVLLQSTGEIKEYNELTVADREGIIIQIPDSDLSRVKKMSQNIRYAWAAEQRRR